ncbi:hypothetical protein GW17_00054744 [Ensete ventricosum]|nr:hypothetical protein GW17_00054744 [Ensete ventricosum]
MYESSRDEEAVVAQAPHFEMPRLATEPIAEKPTCELGYKIALTHFRTKHTGLEVEEDPYATLPEDDNVLMEVEVPFDDSDPIAM